MFIIFYHYCAIFCFISYFRNGATVTMITGSTNGKVRHEVANGKMSDCHTIGVTCGKKP